MAVQHIHNVEGMLGIPTDWTTEIDSKPKDPKDRPNLSQLLTKCRFQESEAVVADIQRTGPIEATILEIMYI